MKLGLGSVGGVWIWGLVLAVSAPHGEAAACDELPTGQEFWVSTEVPVNGVLVVGLYCHDCPADTGVKLRVLDGAYNEVEGEIIESRVEGGDGWVAWKPASPLGVGEEYIVDVDGADYVFDMRAKFDATAETSAEPSGDLLMSIYAYVNRTGEELCCLDSELNSCGEPLCFIDASSAQVRVTVQAEGANSDTFSGSQFVWRSRMYNTDQDVTSDWRPGVYLGGDFSPSDEYCYEIQARHIASGTVTTLVSGCYDNGDLTLPDVEFDREAERRLQLRRCIKPPTGYESEWCRAILEEVEAGLCEDETRHCYAAAEACSRDAATAAIDAGAARDVGVDAEARSPRSTGAREPATRALADDSGDSSGCDVARVPASGSAASRLGGLCALGVAGAAGLRRRASHQRRASK
jgi:hypothetical protein